MFVIGTVAGPKDNDLPVWAEHWKDRGRLLILVQGTHQWFDTPLAERLLKAAPEACVIPVLPVGNPDVHWNTLMAVAEVMADYEGLLIKGTDEFMTDKCWNAMVKVAESDPGARVFWMFRRDLFDGNSFPGMEGDYQPTFVRGCPMHYGGRFHSYPSPNCSVDLIRYLPRTIEVEHRRSLDRTIKANREREMIARPHEAQIQNTFLMKLKAAYEARGLKWPEKEQK